MLLLPHQVLHRTRPDVCAVFCIRKFYLRRWCWWQSCCANCFCVAVTEFNIKAAFSFSMAFPWLGMEVHTRVSQPSRYTGIGENTLFTSSHFWLGTLNNWFSCDSAKFSSWSPGLCLTSCCLRFRWPCCHAWCVTPPRSIMHPRRFRPFLLNFWQESPLQWTTQIYLPPRRYGCFF